MNVSVRFQLAGFPYDPEEVTAATGVAPTKTWRRGDVVAETPRGVQRRRRNTWIVESDVPAGADTDPGRALDLHLASVLDRLAPGAETLSRLGAEHDAAVLCTVAITGSTVPTISFDRATIRQVASLNAALDVDVYVLSGSGGMPGVIPVR